MEMRIGSPATPIIVAGDFNVIPKRMHDWPVHEYFTLDLVDTAAAWKGAEAIVTFGNAQLDYIMASPHLVPRELRVFAPILSNASTQIPTHSALVARLAWSERSEA